MPVTSARAFGSAAPAVTICWEKKVDKKKMSGDRVVLGAEYMKRAGPVSRAGSVCRGGCNPTYLQTRNPLITVLVQLSKVALTLYYLKDKGSTNCKYVWNLSVHPFESCL